MNILTQVETSGMNNDHDMEKLEHCIEAVFDAGCASDGVMGKLLLDFHFVFVFLTGLFLPDSVFILI